MRLILATALFSLVLGLCQPASAQQSESGNSVIDGLATSTDEPSQEQETDTGDVTDTPAPRKRTFSDEPQLRLRILDKVKAESRTYDLDVGQTVAYANIRIRPRACKKSSPLDDPENAAFLQIWEIRPNNQSAWVFSGWMFSSSPSISAMDHPVYDVTVLDCRNPRAESQSESQESTPEEGDTVDDEKSPTDEALEAYISDGSTNETPETDNASDSSE